MNGPYYQYEKNYQEKHGVPRLSETLMTALIFWFTW